MVGSNHTRVLLATAPKMFGLFFDILILWKTTLAAFHVVRRFSFAAFVAKTSGCFRPLPHPVAYLL
jgi:hypothetical protein